MMLKQTTTHMDGGEKIQYDTCERWEFDPWASKKKLISAKRTPVQYVVFLVTFICST